MTISRKVADYLIRTKGIQDKDEQEVLIFGSEVFFGMILGTVVTLLLAYILGLHMAVFFMIVVSLAIRKTAGGAHSDDPTNCLIISALVYNVLALFAKETVVYILHYIEYLVLTTFVIGIILVWKYSPVESPQKPLGQSQKRNLRRLAIIVTILIFILQIMATKSQSLDYMQINYSVCLILLWQFFMLSSKGHSLIHLVDKGILYMKGGRKHEKV